MIPLSARSENKENRISKTGKKKNLTESEMEVLLSEVEARGLESVSEAFNAVGSEKRTQAEVKKKWSDIKVDVKRRLAAHRQSVAKTGGGGCLNRKSAQLWVTLLSQGW